MGLYIGLYKYTEAGIKNIKDAPKRFKDAVKAAEALGGKIINLYSTMGEYDYVGISEFPNDEVATTFMLALGPKGSVRSTTLKAHTMDQFSEIVNKLP